MIIINDNDYSNPYNERNYDKTKIKEWISKLIKVLLTCVVTQTIVIEITKILKITIMIIKVIIIIINKSNLNVIMKLV